MRGIDGRYFLKACAFVLVFVLGLTIGSSAFIELSDVGPHNRFVKAFNDYTESLNRGVKDLRKIHKARATFHELEKSAGWPAEPCK